MGYYDVSLISSQIQVLHLIAAQLGLPIEKTTPGPGKPIGWQKAARMFGMRAKVVRASLDAISNDALPAVLELKEEGKVIILVEKEGRDGFVVQFPDARESFISRERLDEFYNGRCIYLSALPHPDRVSWTGKLSGIASKLPTLGFFAVLAASLVWNLWGHQFAFEDFESAALSRVVSPLFATSLTTMGLFYLRREFWARK